MQNLNAKNLWGRVGKFALGQNLYSPTPNPSLNFPESHRKIGAACASSQLSMLDLHLVTVPNGQKTNPMLYRGATKSSPLSEILFLGSGMVIFLPLLLILGIALAGITEFR